jgi:hypothetical protein
MGVAIVGAEQHGTTFTFTVCADYSGKTKAVTVGGDTVYVATQACDHDASAHAVYAFPAEPPDNRSAAEWAKACAREAYLLAQQEQAEQPATPLKALGL